MLLSQHTLGEHHRPPNRAAVGPTGCCVNMPVIHFRGAVFLLWGAAALCWQNEAKQPLRVEALEDLKTCSS